MRRRRRLPRTHGDAVWVELRLAPDGTPIMLFAEDSTCADRDVARRWLEAWTSNHLSWARRLGFADMLTPGRHFSRAEIDEILREVGKRMSSALRVERHP